MNRREVIRALSGGVAGLPAVASIEVAKLSDGDTIVLSYPGPMSNDHKKFIEQSLKGVWPNNQVLVLDCGLELKVFHWDHGRRVR